MLPVEAEERLAVEELEVVAVLRCLTTPLDAPAPDLVTILLVVGLLAPEPTVVALADWVMIEGWA